MSDSLFAHEIGTGGEPVVFLHGFGAGHFVWRDIQPVIAAFRSTIAYDLPGHGGSLAFAEAGPPKVAAKAVLADLDARGVGRFHLVGHSMGGAIATLIAAGAPERVASLMALAPGGYGETIDAAHLRRYAAADTPAALSAALRVMYGPDFALAPALVAPYAEAVARPGQTDRLVEIAALLFRGERQGVIPYALRAGLAMPVKVLWGREDRILPFSHTEGLPPRMALHAFAGAGHMLADECAADVIHLIRQNIR
ncbi:alpha/beta fold hydrolase [Nitratireductor alexandrii]|uniref:alpha/beta fold hydrolase n=1 Tax=Nitratireductor alexandrii TaxID=2448161 RepID=UPI000FD9FDB5|nr:alpha/beta fold hydrolase [Nitratireductor alexandrii]